MDYHIEKKLMKLYASLDTLTSDVNCFRVMLYGY